MADVNAAGPADQAGVLTGDIILDFGGTRIETMRDLTRAVADTTPGKRSTIRVLRDGAERVLSVRAAPYPT